MQATIQEEQAEAAGDTAGGDEPELPTTPCSVVWSSGHAYVLEGPAVWLSARWVGLDDNGRPLALTADELRRRGWSPHPG